MLLYRFRPFNEHTKDELLTEKLHFSHPSTWNDPFEAIRHNRSIGLDVDGGSRYVCFSIGSNRNKKMLQNILMWSHYADSHKGICVEYECEYTLIGDIHRNSVSYQIKYENQKTAYSPSVLSFFGKGEDIFKSNKAKCWNYENEYRIQTRMHHTNTNFKGINIPYSEIGLKIKAIYCGVKFEESQIETLKLIKGKRDFEIFTGKVENYTSIKFTNTGAVERT